MNNRKVVIIYKWNIGSVMRKKCKLKKQIQLNVIGMRNLKVFLNVRMNEWMLTCEQNGVILFQTNYSFSLYKIFFYKEKGFYISLHDISLYIQMHSSMRGPHLTQTQSL